MRYQQKLAKLEVLTEIQADLYPKTKKINYEFVELFWPLKMDVLKDWIYVPFKKKNK